jgi:hypothetical protein
MVTLTIKEYNKTKITKYRGFLCSMPTKIFGVSPSISKIVRVGQIIGGSF